jgi:MFS family permease
VTKEEKVYVAYSLLTDNLPYYFVGMLLLYNVGYSYTSIGLMGGIAELVSIVSNVPSQILLSRVGVKRIMMLSIVLKLIGFALLFFVNPAVALFAAVLLGASEGLVEGNAQIYLCLLTSDELRYQTLYRKIAFWSRLLTAALTISSTALMTFNLFIPLIVSILFLLTGLILLSGLPDVSERLVSKVNQGIQKQSQLVMMPIFVLGLTMAVLIMVTNTYASLLLQKSGVSVAYIGFILFIFNLMMAFGSYLAQKINIALLPLVAVYGLMALAIGLIGKGVVVTLALFFVLRLVNGIWQAEFTPSFNQLITENRSLAWSYYTTVLSIVFMIADASFGHLADMFGIRWLYLIVGVLGLLTLVMTKAVTVKAHD